jgi:hypothetical protein
MKKQDPHSEYPQDLPVGDDQPDLERRRTLQLIAAITALGTGLGVHLSTALGAGPAPAPPRPRPRYFKVERPPRPGISQVKPVPAYPGATHLKGGAPTAIYGKVPGAIQDKHYPGAMQLKGAPPARYGKVPGVIQHKNYPGALQFKSRPGAQRNGWKVEEGEGVAPSAGYGKIEAFPGARYGKVEKGDPVAPAAGMMKGEMAPGAAQLKGEVLPGASQHKGELAPEEQPSGFVPGASMDKH